MVILIPTKEEIEAYEKSHALLNTAWKEACDGRDSPAVVSFEVGKSGRLSNVQFPWSTESRECEQRGIKLLQKLRAQDGVLRYAAEYSGSYWIGVPPHLQEGQRETMSWATNSDIYGKIEEAESQLKGLLEKSINELGESFPGVAAVYSQLGYFYFEHARYDEHDEAMEKELKIRETCYQRTPTYFASSLNSTLNEFIRCYLFRNDLESAIQVKARLEAFKHAASSEDAGMFFVEWLPFATYYERNNEIDKAADALSDELNRLEKNTKDPYIRYEILHRAAAFSARHQRFAEAEKLYEEFLTPVRENGKKCSYEIYQEYCTLLQMQGRDADLAKLKQRLGSSISNPPRKVTPETGYGFIDCEGKWAIPPKFLWASSFESGVASVAVETEDPRDPGLRMIDRSGTDLGVDNRTTNGVRLPPGYSYYRRHKDEFKEGLAAVVEPTSDEWPKGRTPFPNGIGYANQSGEIVIPPKFTTGAPFCEGLAIVGVGGRVGGPGCVIDLRNARYGVINRAGEFVIPPEFTRLFRLDKSRFSFSRSTSAGIIDSTGKIISDEEGCSRLSCIEDGMISATFHEDKDEKKDGYFDASSGKLVIDPKFDFGWDFSEDRAIVVMETDWKHGFIDKSGEIVINPKFDHAESFKHGLAIVKIDDKVGCIDKFGNFVIEPIYEDISEFDQGISKFTSKGKQGLIDQSGTIVCQPQFDNIDDFHNGLAIVAKSGKHGFLNRSGQLIVETKFDKLERMGNGIAAAAVRKGLELLWGFINESGSFVVKPQFESVQTFSEGLAPVEFRGLKGGKFGYIDTNGTVIVSGRFDTAEPHKNGTARVGVKSGDDMYYGILDVSGKLILQPEYKHVSRFSEGLCVVGCRRPK